MNATPALKAFAIVYGLASHLTFALAVGSMAYALATGLQHGLGSLHGGLAIAANAALALQFPLLHSWLLSTHGRNVLRKIAPWGGGRLATTTYAWVGSLQLLAAFWLWSPTGIVWRDPSEVALLAHALVFACAWLFLVKALWDAGLALQTGAAGWTAVVGAREVRYGGLPERGLFQVCRQPIYLGFALVLLTAPCWTPDWLALCAVWTLYCVLGPRLKERRWLRIYGDRFERYRRAVPYMIPRRAP